MATDINQYLSESIETHKMKHIQKEVDAFQAKADEVKANWRLIMGVICIMSFAPDHLPKIPL